MKGSTDVLVVGSGPAGWAAAAAFGSRGLDTVLVAPDPEGRWSNTYGAWLHDLADPELVGAMRRVWPRVRVRHERTELVDDRYGLVDGAAWASILRERCARAGVRVVTARVDSVVHGPAGSAVAVGAARLQTRVVVDASGAGSALVARRGAASLYQVAWGEVVEAEIGPDMRWMEFGDEGSFLYAMPLGGGRAFVEETVLVTRGIGLDVLRERLHRRLAAEGLRIGRTLSIERCRIPMDLPVPPPQRVIAFGAAAGMIHPATGFLLPRIIRSAPLLAAAVADHLDDGPDIAARAGWTSLWPAERLRQRELHRWGAEVLSQLDARELRAFFAAFFALPPEDRRAWLADSLPPAGIARGMLAVFARLPTRLKWRVATGSRAILSSLVPRLLEVR